MNDERFLKDWLQDTSDTDSEPQPAADKVMAVVPETSQRSRWWPLRRSSRPSELDPSPEAPGRTTSMLTPVKTLTGVALAFAVGGMFLLAQPSGNGPGTGPAGAELDPTLASVVTGTVTFSTSSLDTDGTDDISSGVIRTEGIHYTNLWKASDPRLSGTVTYDGEWLRFPQADFQVEAATRVLENEEGRWVGRGSALASNGSSTNLDTVVLHGEEAYQGLTAYVLLDWTASPAVITGVIVPGDLPTAPEPLSE